MSQGKIKFRLKPNLWYTLDGRPLFDRRVRRSGKEEFIIETEGLPIQIQIQFIKLLARRLKIKKLNKQ